MLNARRLRLAGPAAMRPSPGGAWPRASSSRYRRHPASIIGEEDLQSPARISTCASGRLDAHARLDEHALGDRRKLRPQTDRPRQRALLLSRPARRPRSCCGERLIRYGQRASAPAVAPGDCLAARRRSSCPGQPAAWRRNGSLIRPNRRQNYSRSGRRPLHKPLRNRVHRWVAGITVCGPFRRTHKTGIPPSIGDVSSRSLPPSLEQ